MSLPSSCVVLIPVGSSIDPGCEEGLRELERRGYAVWRVRGYSAIDAARNQLATDALAKGYDELMWIDSDIVFHPDDVERLRSHNLPFACGLYAKKGPRQFACEFLPGTTSVKFGKHGGLVEVRYCGFGFILVRREVFETVRSRLELPECNQRFGKPLVPYFQPMVVAESEGTRNPVSALETAVSGFGEETRFRSQKPGFRRMELVAGRGLFFLRAFAAVRVRGHGRHDDPIVARWYLSIWVGGRGER